MARHRRRCAGAGTVCTIAVCLAAAVAVAGQQPAPTTVTLRYGAVVQPPFLIPPEPDGDGEYGGVLPALLAAVAADLNANPVVNGSGSGSPLAFAFDLVPYPTYAALAADVMAGALNLSSLLQGLAPASDGSVSATAPVYGVPWHAADVQMAVGRGSTAPDPWGLIRPLAPATWAAFGAVVAVLGGAAYFVDAASPEGSHGYGFAWPCCGRRILPRRPKSRRARSSRLAAQAEHAAALHNAVHAAAHLPPHDEAMKLVPTMYNAVVASMEFEKEPHLPRARSMRVMIVISRIIIIFMLAAYESSLNAQEVAAEYAKTRLALVDIQRGVAAWATTPVLAPLFAANSQYAVREMTRTLLAAPTTDLSLIHI